jgi:hypothetical protein
MTETVKRIPRQRGGQPENQNAYKHGRFTARAKAERAWVRWLIRQSRAQIKVTRELADHHDGGRAPAGLAGASASDPHPATTRSKGPKLAEADLERRAAA